MFSLRLPLFLFTTVAASQSTTLAAQGSPGDIILQATRSVEAADSSVIVQWRQAVSEREGAEGTGFSQEAREATLGLATVAWLTYRFEEARERLASLLTSALPADPITAFAWIVQGEAEVAQAHLPQADSAFSSAVEAGQELGDDRARAWGLIRLANVRGRLTGDPGSPAALLAAAQPLLEADDPFLRGQFHCVRAGNDPSGSATAEADARAGLELAQAAGIRRLHAACLHVLASDLLRRGRTDDALATFAEEQEEQKAIGDRSGRAATLQWAGYLLFTAGDFAASNAYLLEAVSEGETSGNLSPVAWAYLSLSGIAVGLGDLAGGDAYLDRAQTLLEAQGDQWGLATLRGRRAAVAFAAGDWDTARTIWEATLTEHERAGNTLGVFSTQTGLLELALAEGDLVEGEQRLRAARATAQRAGMGEWEVSLSFHEAELALRQRDGTRARAALDRFLLPGQFSVRTYRARMRYAEALALDGRVSDAADFMASALDALEEWRSGLDALELQRYAFQVGEYVADPDLGGATVLAAMAREGLVERAFDLAERQRARRLFEEMVLAEIGRHHSVDDAQDDETVPPPPPPLSAKEVLAAFPDPSLALIEFVTGRGGEPTTAFVLSGNRTLAVELPPADSLERDIGLLRSLAESGEDFGTVASRLGERILEPVLRGLPDAISELVFIPSGALHRLPFDLLEAKSASPLVRRFAVSVAPSASVLARLWAAADPPSPSFLVMGDPTLPESDPGGFTSLAGASREAEAVARFGQPAHLRTGSKATEAYLRVAPLEEFGVLHFATHAVVDESSIAATYLVLAPGEGEDGLLWPGDIARLRLGPSLVVLSACRTAGGVVVRGEGVQGLTAPFLAAGARAVLATLWPVEDRSVEGLIGDFYGALARGEKVGQALRTAKLSSLDRGDPPGAWAAFTVAGNANMRVPAVEPRSGAEPGALILLLAVLVTAGLGSAKAWKLRRGPRRPRV